MPLVSQTNINRLMNSINEANENLAKIIQDESTNFAEKLYQVWASKRAKEFAVKTQTAMEEISNEMKSLLTQNYERIKETVDSHNRFNNDNIVVAPLSLVTPSIIIAEKVKEYFEDGAVADVSGIKMGAKAMDAVEAFDHLTQRIQTAIEQAKNGIKASGAFDEDELNALVRRFGKSYDNCVERMAALRHELKDTLGLVDSEAAEIASKSAME